MNTWTRHFAVAFRSQGRMEQIASSIFGEFLEFAEVLQGKRSDSFDEGLSSWKQI